MESTNKFLYPNKYMKSLILRNVKKKKFLECMESFLSDASINFGSEPIQVKRINKYSIDMYKIKNKKSYVRIYFFSNDTVVIKGKHSEIYDEIVSICLLNFSNPYEIIDLFNDTYEFNIKKCEVEKQIQVLTSDHQYLYSKKLIKMMKLFICYHEVVKFNANSSGIINIFLQIIEEQIKYIAEKNNLTIKYGISDLFWYDKDIQKYRLIEYNKADKITIEYLENHYEVYKNKQIKYLDFGKSHRDKNIKSLDEKISSFHQIMLKFQ